MNTFDKYFLKKDNLLKRRIEIDNSLYEKLVELAEIYDASINKMVNVAIIEMIKTENVKLYERESLIIFDEVQLYPRARSAIKYLVADGRYDYIETGSLVSINENVKDILIPSEEQHLKMYPMDFEEFLWALDNHGLMELIEKSFNERKPLGNIFHRKAMDYFRQYMIVGGMPQAVLEYVNTKDFNKVDQIKRNILDLYREDIIKHSGKYSLKVRSIFDEIPSQLQKHEKKFRITSLDKDAKTRDYEDAFMWLDDAMIVNQAFNTTEPSIGLSLNLDNSFYKCYMSDTGLLISKAFDEKSIVEEEIYKKILFDKLEYNGGMILENIVAQMLVSSGHKLYFYSNSSRENSNDRMEIDFLISKSKITNKHNISPIEVKSGKNKQAKSLKSIIQNYKTVTRYMKFENDCNIYKDEENIEHYPLFMIMFI